MPDYKEMARNGYDAFGNFSAGYDVGGSTNGYEVFTNILNLAGQVAPTLGPAGAAFGVGLNAAAATNNSVSVIDKFNKGTLQPSDVLQVSGAILGGLTAAAVITGASVPLGVAMTIAGIAIASGPFAKDAVNAAIHGLAEHIAEGISPETNKNPDFPNAPSPAVDIPNTEGPHIDPRTGTGFTSAQKFVPRKDPLTFDLNGNGLDTVGLNKTNPIYFDHDGDGIRTATGWVLPSDGFLVLDRNGNGGIDNGSELFGDSTPLYVGGRAVDGFAALAQEDTNSDGRVDAADQQWSRLRIWQDNNQDGVSQNLELLSLNEAGIVAINVKSTSNAVPLPNGNLIADLGTFIRLDGSIGDVGELAQVADIDLAEDTFESKFTDSIPLLETVLGMPHISGSGQVRDLLQAASIDSSAGRLLKEKLSAFSDASTREEQQAAIDDLIFTWGSTSSMPTSVAVNLTPSWHKTWSGNTPVPGRADQIQRWRSLEC